MKLLVLVICSHNELYDELYKYMCKIILKAPQNVSIKLLYNNADPNVVDVSQPYVFSFTEKESLIPGIFNKTIYGLVVSNYKNYDYILRTNMSTFFKYPELLHFLETHPQSHVYSAMVKRCSKHNNIKFGVGFCLIFHRTICSQVIQQIKTNKKIKEKINVYPDDVLFGYIFHKLKIHVQDINSHLLINNDIYNNTINNKFIIRNREYHFNVDNTQNFQKRKNDEIPRWEYICTHYL